MPSRSAPSRPEQRRVITDVRVLAALSHPVRFRLLSNLLELGPCTATECAPTVGVSPSACSYHLRHLERFGLVERVVDDEADDGDGRRRPWRAVATGYSIAPSPSSHDVVTRTATVAVVSASVAASNDLAERFLAGALSLPDEWQDAADFNNYGLAVDAAELRAIVDAIDAIVRPFLAMTRTDPPADARIVHVALHAFPRPEP